LQAALWDIAAPIGGASSGPASVSLFALFHKIVDAQVRYD